MPPPSPDHPRDERDAHPADAHAPERPTERPTARPAPRQTGHRSLPRQIETVERDGGDGILAFDGGATLHVSSLDRLWFPEVPLTKGGLMRYYVRVAPSLLPEIDGRPLALVRYPGGVGAPSFFQHEPERSTPADTRTTLVPVERGGEAPRYVGGDLLTLLHTVQIGTIAVNPWHSRVGTLDSADYCVLDLDPGPEAPFGRVVEVAGWVRASLAALGLAAALKTSGSRGLHILVPLPPGTTYSRSAAIAERVATGIARSHPGEATVERSLAARAPGQIYVDHMQNARGKTLASVFSVRARPLATVSTPLSWRQLAGPGLDPTTFTVTATPAQRSRLADRWRRSIDRPNSAHALDRALDRALGASQ